MSNVSRNGTFHLLLVEDNPADVYLLREALQSAEVDCDLTVIDDGGEALAFIRQYGTCTDVPALDLAILDLNLPKSEGLEVLQALRASPAFAQVPVVILSSSSSPRELERTREFHVERYIPKPPDLDEFLRIGSVLREVLQAQCSRT